MSKTIAGYQVHPAAKLFPLMVGAEFDALCDDIQHNGLLDDLVLWCTGGQDWLLDGRNRGHACDKTGIKPTFTHYEGTDPFGYVVSHNLHRRQLTPSQLAMVGARLKDVLAVDALERQREGGREGGKSGGKLEASRPQATERRPQARDQAAKMVSVGGRAVQKAAKVIEHGTPELQASVDAGIVRVDLAAQIADRSQEDQQEVVRKIADDPTMSARAVVRQHDRDAVTASIEAEVPLPDGPFRVLMVNFPWPHGKRPKDGAQHGQAPYPIMSAGDIEIFAQDKLRPLAHDDSVLFLCITNAHLVSGDHVAVLKAAGFTGKTILSWDKERMGTADWFRGQTEHFIMATKGRPTTKLINQKTALPTLTDEGLYKFIEDLCPGNKVELFSRTERPNWTQWGAEAGSFEAELGL